MSLPLVSVLVTVHDDASRVGATLDDVLTQDYPQEAIELIVVDDGSQDATADVLDEYRQIYPGRLRVLRQPRGGASAALDRALREARGELLAPLAAGDRWPHGRVRAQVALLERRPEVGLVYSRMLPRDNAHGTPVWLPELEVDPPRGRPVGRLLREEIVAPSSLLLRATLLDRLTPIPSEIPRAGWWLTVRAAKAGEIEWLPETPDGVVETLPHPGDRVTRLREQLLFQRWFLRRTTSESMFLDELGEIWRAFAAGARKLLSAADDPFAELIPVSDADRADARRLLADAREALSRGDSRPGLALAARAAATDPFCDAARTLLAEALARRPRRSPSDPLAGARRFVTLAFADELLADCSLLQAYVRSFDGHADATLAIDASGLTPAAAELKLSRLVHEHGLDGAEGAHLIAVLGPIDAAVRERLPFGVDALLTATPRPAPAAPSFAARETAALRAFAARRSAA
ncbi:glycosyltransferase family A protein [Conexibacter sp. JD483]|uniref:glycosyltransferase family A protein n=1 Tax=unclassified Conexibacter TaxID=2627773 RepID=UPI002715C218|nr:MULTISPECIES: glycosyltransferase family A protein [unclassified Conexibacter]MDO8186481.1 glycosyltransferase family A protein [Conexibacter sp. CPCC 205706]MDO8200050.1 glycosyltransferase family A protein [Conexibacter sp. CPCC 205762]MDR9372276.1 glycosyltransferase family A protein [Conexibacter sp. JD483]